ncbi:MAG TPA: hypothetical protein PLR60_07635 [Syntrophorhabdaceae bacterium]|nr:hypothetical protein [Syntrophorhabdaceae bacterium]
MDGTKATGPCDLNTLPDLNWSIAGTGVFNNTAKRDAEIQEVNTAETK